MQSQLRGERERGAGIGLLGLGSASLATIVVLAIALAGDRELMLGAIGLRELLVLTLLTGVIGFSGLCVVMFRRARRTTWRSQRQFSGEVAELQRRTLQAEALLRLEPQAMLVWDAADSAATVAPSRSFACFTPGMGLPAVATDVLRFSAWLDRDTAQLLSQALDKLLNRRQPFTMTVRTPARIPVEASGWVHRDQLVLRLRELARSREEAEPVEGAAAPQRREGALSLALFEALPMPVWLRSPEGRIDWVNLAYVRAVAAAGREEVRSRQIELLEKRQQRAVETVTGRNRVYRDRQHVIVGGERRAYDVIAVPLQGATANIAVDAGALETAQGELTRQIEAHDRTLDRVATAVAIFRPDQRLSFCNEAYRRLWQLDPSWLATNPRDGEILDQLRERRQLPEEPDYRKWKAKQLAGYGQQTQHEDWWHLPSGKTIHVLAEQRPDGGVTYLYDDVTERIKLESSFIALTNVQRETLDHLKEGVAVFATDGRLRLFNPAFARIWRLNPADLGREPHIDEVIRRCRVLHNDDATWSKLKRAVTGISDQRQRIEGQMVRPDDSVIAYAGLPLPDGAMLLTFIDITDSKRVERVLRERNEALETADRLKSQFISHVSYELRTPLTNIIGFAELLQRPGVGDLNKTQQEYLGAIYTSSLGLNTLVDDILDLATIEAGTLELKLAPIGVEEVIAAATEGVRDRLNRARLSLHVTVAKDARQLVADENRVKQVLYNLLSNAIGFSEPGGDITLGCHREAGMMVFTVGDQGRGIPPELQPHVFERFETRTQGSRHRGAGLGLALVKSLVELHGGSVSLSSQLGQGTRVTVRFPEVVAPAPQPTTAH